MKIYNLKIVSFIYVYYEIDVLYNMDYFKQLFIINWYRIIVLLRYYLLVMMDFNCIYVFIIVFLNIDLVILLGENSFIVFDMSSVFLG